MSVNLIFKIAAIGIIVWFSKLYHVTMQAPAEYRVNAESLHHMYVRATDGGMSPLSQMCIRDSVRTTGLLTRINMYIITAA